MYSARAEVWQWITRQGFSLRAPRFSCFTPGFNGLGVSDDSHVEKQKQKSQKWALKGKMKFISLCSGWLTCDQGWRRYLLLCGPSHLWWPWVLRFDPQTLLCAYQDTTQSLYGQGSHSVEMKKTWFVLTAQGTLLWSQGWGSQGWGISRGHLPHNVLSPDMTPWSLRKAILPRRPQLQTYQYPYPMLWPSLWWICTDYRIAWTRWQLEA